MFLNLALGCSVTQKNGLWLWRAEGPMPVHSPGQAKRHPGELYVIITPAPYKGKSPKPNAFLFGMYDRYNTFALWHTVYLLLTRHNQSKLGSALVVFVGSGRLLYYIFIYPRCRFACLGLWTLRACPFRALLVICYPGCSFRACVVLCTLHLLTYP